MIRLAAIPRPVLRLLAVVFAIATIAYSAVWMHYIRSKPTVSLGMDPKQEVASRLRVSRLTPGGAAERAGLRVGDEVLAINGQPVTTISLPKPMCGAHPGDVVSLLVKRPGTDTPFVLKATLQPLLQARPLTWAQAAALEVLDYYPIVFLVVGLAVLWLRLDSSSAWLLALMFAGFIASAPLAFAADVMPRWLRALAFFYEICLYGMLPAIFYYFFATFPTPSAIDRRIPWLKRWLLILAAVVSIPLAVTVLVTGSLLPLVHLREALPHQPGSALIVIYIFGGYLLGLASLLWNNWRPSTPGDCRKTRVMVWGTVAGFGPALIISAIAIFVKREYFELPFWAWTIATLALFLIPLSFAYAVVKYRVLEVPLLLKRSARYMLVQRGFAALILGVGVAATLLLAGSLKHYFPAHSDLGVPLGAGFGILLVVTGTQVQTQVTRRLDRAFFRSSYDARLILENLGSKTRTVSTRETLAGLLSEQIRQALHPSSLAIYLIGQGSDLVALESAEQLKNLPATTPLLQFLARHGHPWEVPPGAEAEGLTSVLRPLQPEYLVPMLGRQSQLLGFIALGSRLSEEPYSGEDRRLLAAVAWQAAVSIENIKLAEEMAERMEAERLTAQELEIARQVQAKLLPQKTPTLATLEYAGKCVQARAVGGDYYDFLDLGSGRVGFVLADIVGKGISAALLMANLQAHLRSLSAVLAQDLEKSLQSVNRMFCEATEPNKYATLFIGVYDDGTRCLRYANCGHHPPLLVRDGKIEHLNSTATVLGMFEQWECPVAETSMAARDLLVIYTDGVVEATNSSEMEFGEDGILRTIQANGFCNAQLLLEKLVTSVQNFSSGEQIDDLTLVVARGR